MYTVGKYIGNGYYSCFFTLRGHNRLGVKIRLDNDKTKLEKEQAKAQILRKIGVPVPKFIGIISVSIPSYFEKTIGRQFQKGEIRPFDYGMIKLLVKKVVVWGLAMELIDQDVSLVSRQRVAYHYSKELKRIESYGIIVEDSHLNHNVLWSQRKAKLFFIDFGAWIVPENLI